MPIKNCEICGTEYQIKTSAADKSRFCSRKCQSAAKNRKVEKTCPRCSAKFTVPRCHENRQKYCTKACRVDPVSRFWDNVEKQPDGCWIWKGTKAGAGYGALKVNSVMVSAHRFSWELHHGENLSRETYLCHRCDTPLCVNPEHLFKGDAAVNTADRDAKDRQAKGKKIGVSKLTVPQVVEIKELLSHGLPQETIAKQFKVSQMAISMISQDKTWKYVPWPE